MERGSSFHSSRIAKAMTFSLESASADVRTPGLTGQGGCAAAAAAYLPSLLAEPSNPPCLTHPRNACHSPELNRRTSPAAFLLSRTPTAPSGRLATSTQLPLA